MTATVSESGEITRLLDRWVAGDERAFDLVCPPLVVAGQSTATVRFRASRVQGVPVDFLAITTKLQDNTFNTGVLFWQEDHGGEPAEVQL